MPASFAPATARTIPLHVIEESALASWCAALPDAQAAWLKATGFSAALGEVALLPDTQGGISAAVAGFGTAAKRARGRFHIAAAAPKLPEGTYRIATFPEAGDPAQEALGWLLAGYCFTRYRDRGGLKARLVAPDDVDAARLETIAAGEFLTRDLINTPAADMGPDALEEATAGLAARHDAAFTSIRGDALLDRNFPLIHAVGRAGPQAPRLLDLRWGKMGPALTLVGKGVCFDTGGLNLKPAGSMGLMKKDMGGAATVLGLARTIMTLKLPLRLRVLVPAVENSVASASFRPQDILTARNGLTVEINNTDAEGRLVLADALALAAEERPDMLVSMATLTGAARVAVGPDIAPYYTGSDKWAHVLGRTARQEADPVWRMPFHTPYETMIEPGIADLDNAPGGGFAGSVTAALFLRRFVAEVPYIHFDIYGWQPADAPARPKGGVGQGARALLAALPEMLEI
ncbi:leucyl aminopeptidase [Rhodovulum imhoffii]|uniref:Leucyl aminopeptidase n=1 Tax=Rhodovulum imhoffii TaxID=365340 RepID=A0A2T5BSM4_9RHOB|nr:leucyl aminopeptidase family protein [Rhodovulum imhoffii]MBK5933480.1 leucyl aminopeptidase [Rhodovulum imhoffii]PTN02283.1 leucyl aminopeptidase [Rhodovulum imhoffii]